MVDYPIRDAVGEVTVSAPVERRHLDVGAASLDDGYGLWDNLATYAVAGDDGNAFFRAHC